MILVWSIGSEQLHRRFKIEKRDGDAPAVHALLFLKKRTLPTGATPLISGDADGVLRVWDMRPKDDTHKEVRSFPACRLVSETITALATDTHNNLIFVGSSAGRLRIFQFAVRPTCAVLRDRLACDFVSDPDCKCNVCRVVISFLTFRFLNLPMYL